MALKHDAIAHAELMTYRLFRLFIFVRRLWHMIVDVLGALLNRFGFLVD